MIDFAGRISDGTHSVVIERLRQQAPSSEYTFRGHGEGFDSSHDDQYNKDGKLISAAMCYLNAYDNAPAVLAPNGWPWSSSWWKPRSRRENLVRAAALIIAEIDRLDRTPVPPPVPSKIDRMVATLKALLKEFEDDVET